MRTFAFLFSMVALRGGWVIEQTQSTGKVQIVIGEKAFKWVYLSGPSKGKVAIHTYSDDGVAAIYDLWTREKLYSERREMFPSTGSFVSEERIGEETIAGQLCERYRYKRGNVSGEACYAKDISLPEGYWRRALEVEPMHGIKLSDSYVSNSQQYFVPERLRTNSIVKQDLSPDEFTVPSGYQLRGGLPVLKVRPSPF